MKKNRVMSMALAAAMLALSFAGCKAGESSNKIKIGGLAPLTGDVSVYGVATNNGVKLAIKEINENGGVLDKQIDYKCIDEKGDPMEAKSAYNRLVQENIVALIGDVTSKPTNAVAQDAAKDNMPMITPTGTAAEITKKGKNVFRTCFIDPFQGELMAHYAYNKLGKKSAAIIYNISDDYSKGLAESFEKTAKELGINVMVKEGYGKGVVDFRAQLTNIKSKNPDILYLPVYYQDVSLISVQAKELGITSQLLGGDGWDGVLDSIDKSNVSSVNDAFFCSQYSAESDDEKLKSFLVKYKKEYKTEANQFAVLGYDAAYMMVEAIKNAGSTDSDKIIDALKNLDFTGLTGHMTFDENRNPIKRAAITTIKDGAYKFVEYFSVK